MKKNTGEPFEKRVHQWVQSAVNNGTFGLNPKNVRVYHHHPVHSRDRESDIVFDVVLEIFRKGATSPYLMWLWECKDYTHPVPVDDIEEFHAKIEQVGRDNGKGTMISTAGFQQGVVNLARSYGIGLMRVVQRGRPSGAEQTKARTLGDLVGEFDKGGDVVSVREFGPSERGRGQSAAALVNLIGSLLGSVARDEPQPQPASVRQPTPDQLILGADAHEDGFVYQPPDGATHHRETWQQIVAVVAGQLTKPG